jgi:nitrate/TMAO reductase-like tetraheme cytochrome c subunit
VPEEMNTPKDSGAEKRQWWKLWWVWTIVAPVLLIVMTTIAAISTSQSSFCVTCHYMEPFYESWQSSTHKDVECVVCHYPPGIESTIRGKLRGLEQVISYVSQAYKRSRPWAEIDDASCMRAECHGTVILEDSTTVSFNGVIFKHKPHLSGMRRGKRLRCTSCHSQIVQGEHMVVTPSTCNLCHLRQGGALGSGTLSATSTECSLCHKTPGDPERGTHPDVEQLGIDCVRCHVSTVVGDGAVSLDRCFSCHWEQERMAAYDSTETMHQIHITENKIECLNCHARIEHRTVNDHAAGPRCEGCHPGLHQAQQVLFSGIGARNVPAMPNGMFERGIRCESCHIYHDEVRFPELGETIRSNSEACEGCHGRGFAKLLGRWDDEIALRARRVRMAETRIRGHRSASSTAWLSAVLDSVDYNVRIVEKGKPVHNAVFANAILDSSYSMMVAAGARMEPPITLAPLAQPEGNIPTECGACHFEVSKATLNAFGRIPFTHEKHVTEGGIDCRRCHSHARTHGEMVLEQTGCASCHHQAANEADCAPCHEAQDRLFSGRSATLGDRADPDTNPHVENECRSCHGGDDDVVAATSDACLECHEEGYDETLADWQDETRAALNELGATLDGVTPSGLSATKRRTYRKARAALNSLIDDKSLGAHNAEQTQAILEQAATLVEDLQ